MGRVRDEDVVLVAGCVGAGFDEGACYEHLLVVVEGVVICYGEEFCRETVFLDAFVQGGLETLVERTVGTAYTSDLTGTRGRGGRGGVFGGLPDCFTETFFSIRSPPL